MDQQILKHVAKGIVKAPYNVPLQIVSTVFFSPKEK